MGTASFTPVYFALELSRVISVNYLQVYRAATTPIRGKVLGQLQSRSLRSSASLTTESEFLVVLEKWGEHQLYLLFACPVRHISLLNTNENK